MSETSEQMVVPRAKIRQLVESLGLDSFKVKWMEIYPTSIVAHLAVATDEPMPPPEQLDPWEPNKVVTRWVRWEVRDVLGNHGA
jgi:hypothetical protein